MPLDEIMIPTIKESLSILVFLPPSIPITLEFSGFQVIRTSLKKEAPMDDLSIDLVSKNIK